MSYKSSNLKSAKIKGSTRPQKKKETNIQSTDTARCLQTIQDNFYPCPLLEEDDGVYSPSETDSDDSLEWASETKLVDQAGRQDD